MKGNKSIKRFFTRLYIRLFGKTDSEISYVYYELNIIPRFNKSDSYIVEKYISHRFGGRDRYRAPVSYVECVSMKAAKEWIKWDKNKESVTVIKQ